MPGRCIILEQDLQVSKLDESSWDRKFCAEEGRLVQGRTKERFAYCQQGVSPAFTSDKHHILFGAPGVYDWKVCVRECVAGMLFQFQDV